MKTLLIQDLPAGGFPDNHKHFLGIIGLAPDQEDIGSCRSCGQGRIIRFTVGVQPPGSQEVTPHITGQACNVCGYRTTHHPDEIVFLTERNAADWLTPPELRG